MHTLQFPRGRYSIARLTVIGIICLVGMLFFFVGVQVYAARRDRIIAMIETKIDPAKPPM